MAGAILDLPISRALSALGSLEAVLADPDALLESLGERLFAIHRRRFAAQRSPDGVPWAPLSEQYRRRKKKNRDKILTLDGYLRNTLRWQVRDGALLFGSDRAQAAWLHFGGSVTMPARAATVHFRQAADGSIGNRFVKKTRSNFAQDVKVGPYTVNMPARHWLGTSDEDDRHLLAVVMQRLDQALS